MSDQSPIYRKEFIFDIDTKQGDKYFGSYRKIYPIIGRYLNKNGFMKGIIKMSKSEALHELYEKCKNISIDEADDLVVNAPNSEEKGFIRVATDYFLQQRQKKVVAEKRF